MLIEAKVFSLILNLLLTLFAVLLVVIVFGLIKLVAGSKIPPKFKAGKSDAIVRKEET